jgi:hypothetical protein
MSNEAVIRPAVAALSRFPRDDFGKMTFREAIEWWKGIVREIEDQKFQLTMRESTHLNEQWAVLVDAVSQREGVPPGLVSQLLGETANMELQALQTALREAEDAV